ncbi:5'-methylthioadenosine/S-adenosylhomocysteine nucleosidase [Geobacter sp. OR-1]|uniref:phosphorylase family protein n=1 Tax=Geobacter sp. OR-1 TaxID=1266765 RepID=UPI000543CF1C|nr:hypothetical protein [Geobacter sp. OR-1]GAM11421.1 5'-methylthioadenosine/S-adenosylhomocysteine nucleosidase [Geobacter sp. OR-1]
MQRIGLIAAMQEEIRPLLRQVKVLSREKVGGHHIYRLDAWGQSICLVESGMGPDNAAAATRLLIDTARPDRIVNFGFAGSLTPDLSVGDVVCAERLLFLHGRLFSEQHGLNGDSPGSCPEVRETCGIPVIGAAFVTTRKITSKKEIAGLLPTGIRKAVVEMETSAVAQVANSHLIPLTAIRSISDSFDDELSFSLDEFCDKNLNLQTWRVMLTIAKKPWIMPQLVRLARNSKKAGENLAGAIAKLLHPVG